MKAQIHCQLTRIKQHSKKCHIVLTQKSNVQREQCCAHAGKFFASLRKSGANAELLRRLANACEASIRGAKKFFYNKELK